MLRAELIELLKRQPWGDKTRRYFYSREEEHVEGLRGALGLWCIPAAFGNMGLIPTAGVKAVTFDHLLLLVKYVLLNLVRQSSSEPHASGHRIHAPNSILFLLTAPFFFMDFPNTRIYWG